MKKTLVFELFASILVVALLAGLNAIMGKSSELDHELTLLSLNTGDVTVNAHRRHHGARHGHAPRHHERRRPVQHSTQGAQPQTQPDAAPAAQPAATIPHDAPKSGTGVQPPRVQ
ncbi:MAG: hypothetical protein U1F27_12280 [Turneriella sp.]